MVFEPLAGGVLVLAAELYPDYPRLGCTGRGGASPTELDRRGLAPAVQDRDSHTGGLLAHVPWQSGHKKMPPAMFGGQTPS